MQVKNLSFRHHKKAPYFFKDLSFHLERGQLHALHGKNGIGKSILLQILSKSTLKEAVIEGEIIGGEAIFLNQRFEETLVKEFSFLENLQFGAISPFPSPFSRLKTPAFFKEERILKIIEKFHIDLRLPVYQLSGGQRQILSLLLKLQKKADILLLDEPTATLDEENAIMVFEFLKTLQGLTILVVCHDQSLINSYTTGIHLQLEIDSLGIRTVKAIS